MQRYLVGVSYIGTNLSGFTRSGSSGLPSVSCLVGRALDSFCAGSSKSNTVRGNNNWRALKCASRTDAGVHAVRNCFTVDIERGSNNRSGASFSPAAVADGLNMFLSQQTSRNAMRASIGIAGSDAVVVVDDTRNSYRNQSQLRSVIVRDVRAVPKDFLPWNATSRVYTYRILCPVWSVEMLPVTAIDDDVAVAKDAIRFLFEESRSWALSVPLDVMAMQYAADVLRNGGEETDYSSFRSSGCASKSPVRRLLTLDVSAASEVVRGGGECIAVTVRVESASFLLHQVRNIVALLVEVGRGRMSPEEAGALLARRDRRANKLKPAPAEGLYLDDVKYAKWDR